MSIFSNFLNLFKYEPTTDAQNTFNIQTALNDNWDKLDDFAENVSEQLSKRADKGKTITRQNWQTITGTLLDFIKTQVINGNVYGSLWCNGGTDMNDMSGYITWRSDSGASGTIYVDFDVVSSNKKYYRSINLVTSTWMQDKWQQITTEDDLKTLKEMLDGKGTYRIEIPSGADLNNYKAAGRYNCPSTSTVSSIVNKPGGLSYGFVMDIIESNGQSGYLVQRITDLYGNQFYRSISYATGEPYYGNWFTLPSILATGGAISISKGGTGANDITTARTNLGAAPVNHASTTAAYGVATETQYGHVKVVNNLLAGTGNIDALAAAQGKILNDSKAPKHQSGTTEPSTFVGEGVLYGVHS